MTVSEVASDKKDREALRDEVLRYLAIDGLSTEQTRVVYDGATKHNLFRLVGKAPLPPALLQQVAQRLAGYGVDRNWQARLVIDDPKHEFDKLLKTNKREFDIALDWGQADVDAYVFSEAFSPYSIVAEMAHSEPRTVRCMLSFQPTEKLPEVEYSLSDLAKANGDDTTGDATPDPMREQMMAMFKQMSSAVEHQLTFDAPLLKSSFEEGAQVKNGKVMFKFAVIESTTVFDPVMGGHPMDMGGTIHRDCEKHLEADFPRLNRLFVQREFFKRVVAFAPATLTGVGK